jgi:hypothetical protein
VSRAGFDGVATLESGGLIDVRQLIVAAGEAPTADAPAARADGGRHGVVVQGLGRPVTSIRFGFVFDSFVSLTGPRPFRLGAPERNVLQ